MRIDERRVERVVDKVEYVEESLELLAEKQSVGPDEYADARERKDVVERRFETMTQACIDIARMLLTTVHATQPEANAAAMRELGRRGV